MPENPSPLTRRVYEELQDILAGPPSPATLNAGLRLLAKWRAQLVENTLVQESGTKVMSGPFTGMSYAVRATEGARIARLIGCYEASLTPVIEEIIAGRYERVIDIGCAEGYYAVGLARRMKKTRILARDNDLRAQEACAELAKRNRVKTRIEIGGQFDHADFAICLKKRCAVICDIEGGEDALLDPGKAPGLKAADILVEVHEGRFPGLLAHIEARFRPTHAITRLDRELDASALPAWMEQLSDMDRLIALWEWRAAPTPWLWMKAYE